MCQISKPSVTLDIFIADLHTCSSVQSFSHVRLFVTLWTAVCQASLSIINSWSLLKLMSIELVMPSNHLILIQSLFLLPSIFTSIRVFSNESVLCIRWPKHWNFSFSISPSQSVTAQKSNCLPSPGQLCFPASDGLLGNEESFDFHIHTHMC